MTVHSHKNRTLALADEQGVVRAREFDAEGVPRVICESAWEPAADRR